MKFDFDPYQNNYDADDNYYSVLYKPSLMVQARELNEMQSMMQNQTASIGTHLFKNGSKINGCSTAFVQYDYVTLKDHNHNLENYLDRKLIGETSKVEATIIKYIESQENEPSMLLVMYTKTGLNKVQHTFIPGESVDLVDSSNMISLSIDIRCPGCSGDDTENDLIPSIGKSLIFTIEEGIFYYNNYFVKVHPHNIVIDKYLVKDGSGNIISDNAYRVGLDVVEEIITCDDDKSLLDPHFGYNNFGAPGADRYKISLYLSTRDYVDDRLSNFILLAKVRQNQTVEYKKDDTEYNEIMKEFARRTYEACGDFSIIPWKTRFAHEKKNNINDSFGWSMSGSDEKYVTIIQPGTGYVKGNRVSNISECIARGNKARSTNIISDKKQLEKNSSIIVGIIDLKEWQKNELFQIRNVTDAVIGTFEVIDIQIVDADRVQIFFKNISFTSGNISTAETITSGTGSSFDVLIHEILNENKKDLLYYVGRDHIKEISSLSTIMKVPYSGTLDASGVLELTDLENEFISNTEDFFIINGTKTSYITGSFGNTLTLDFGIENAGLSYEAQISIKKNLVHRQKIKTRHEYTETTVNGTFPQNIVLPHSDILRLDDIVLDRAGTQNSILSDYILDNGQRDTEYKNGSIKNIKNRAFNSSDSLIISYYYFEHSNDGDVFTTNSYENYEDIPAMSNKRMSDYLDFRGMDLPKSGSVIDVEFEYYLPRKDLLLVNTAGEFYLKEGVSSDQPSIPYPDEDAMALYEVHLNAYVYHIDDIKVKYIDNKIFKMKDIARLESRISQIENSVALSLLEQNTINMSVKDQNGLDRYKNGILVDNFKGYYAADVNNNEFKSSLDRYNGELRPQFKQNNIKLALDVEKSKNIKVVGNMAIGKYEHDLFITNPYTTQTLSINPYLIFRKYGKMSLSPNIDTWADTEQLPTIFTDIDTGVDALKSVANASKLLGTDYGAWANFNTSIVSNTNTTVEVANNTRTTTATTTQTSNTTSSRVVETKELVSKTQSYNIEDIVKDVSIIPYIRTRTVEFYASNMKPNTQVYAFFDGQNVTEHCRAFKQMPENGDVVLTRNQSVFGAIKLTTDENGDIIGEFRIPAKTFFVGEKKFVLTNDSSNSGNPDIETSRSEATYFAAGVSQSKQTETMNVITPSYNVSSSTEDRNTTSTSVTVVTDSVSLPVPPPPKPVIPPGGPEIITFEVAQIYPFNNSHQIDWRTINADTVSVTAPSGSTFRINNNQREGGMTTRYTPGRYTLFASNSFGTTTSTFQLFRNAKIVGTPEGSATDIPPPAQVPTPSFAPTWASMDPVAQGFKVDESCFISKVGAFFSSVDNENDVIWFEIREMINGYPSAQGIARKEVKGSKLIDYISENATKEYTVEFDIPVYVDSNKSYAFVIGGSSPETRIYISTLGEKLLGTDNYLEQPPLTYTMFRSLNGATWNAEQFNTMKINIYRAVFDTSPSVFSFYNLNNDFYVNCDEDPIELQPNSNRVRIYAKNHNLRVNDRFILNLNSDIYYKIEVTSGMPQIGQPISTVTGSGYIKNIKILPNLNFYEVSIERTIGTFEEGQEFTCESRKVEYRDIFLITDLGIAAVPINQNVSLGYIRGLSATNNMPVEISGISLSAFTKEHIVREVDSIDTFIIEIESNFTMPGRFGGKNAVIDDSNIKYDTLNIAGQYLGYNSRENWSLTPCDYENGTYTDSVNITPFNDFYLENPSIILSKRNEIRVLGKDFSSFNLNVEMKTVSPYISPVFNIDSFSATTISNRVEVIDKIIYDQLPIGAGRYKEETHATSGSELYKYVTVKVLLDNPASDMKIVFEVNCPSVSDYEVYVKVAKSYTNDTDDQIDWIKVDKFDKIKTSNRTNDFSEIDLLLSDNCSTWDENIEYVSYRVKLVGKSSNSCLPPIFKNLRTIAVT